MLLPVSSSSVPTRAVTSPQNVTAVPILTTVSSPEPNAGPQSAEVATEELEALFVLFLFLRSARQCENLATTVTNSSFFGRRLRRVVNCLVYRCPNYEHLREDVNNRATYVVYRYLQKTGGSRFRGHTADDFSSWLWGLCRRAVKWTIRDAFSAMIGKKPRNSKQLLSLTDLGAIMSAESISPERYLKALQLVRETIQNCKDSKMRKTLADWLQGKLIRDTAENLNVTERSVQNYRARGLALVKRALEKEALLF